MKPHHSQGGFALVCFLAFIPMMITLFFAFAVGGRALVRQSQMRHLCRTQMLKTQSQVAAQITELTALNPEARSLRLQHQAALAAMATATTVPALLPAATASLKAVTLRQRLLNLKQQRLLLAIHQSWRHGSRQVKFALAKAGANEVRLLRPAIGLLAVPSSSLTPDYLPAPMSPRLQRQGAQWRLKVRAPANAQLSSTEWQSGCAATVTQTEGRWQPHLSVAK